MNCTDLFAKFRPDLDFNRLTARPDFALQHWPSLSGELKSCVKTGMLDYYTVPFVSKFLEGAKTGYQSYKIGFTNVPALVEGDEKIPAWAAERKNSYVSPKGQIKILIHERPFAKVPIIFSSLPKLTLAEQDPDKISNTPQDLLCRLQQFNETLEIYLLDVSKNSKTNEPQKIFSLIARGYGIETDYNNNISSLASVETESIQDPVWRKEIEDALEKLETLIKFMPATNQSLCYANREICLNFMEQLPGNPDLSE